MNITRDFYYTDAISDTAVKFISEHATDELQYDMEPRFTRDGRPVRVGWGVAAENPGIVSEMAALWQDWAERTGVAPKPPSVLNRLGWAVGLEE